jgi:hypothetical protein
MPFTNSILSLPPREIYRAFSAPFHSIRESGADVQV